MNKRVFLFIIFLFVSFFQYSVTYKLTAKFLKLEVDEKNGRFLLYGRNSVDSEWIPLISEDYPSTTYFRFFINKKELEFGCQGYGYYSKIYFDGNKIIYSWYNDVINIILTYQFLSYSKSYMDTLLIELRVKNIGYTSINLDYYFCIDTYLGEKERNHFIFRGQTIRSEKDFVKINSDDAIYSYSNKLKMGLNISFPEETSLPSRIFFSNWKRVNKTIGLFTVFPNRDFDFEPYSVNDSSVFIEYQNQQIKRDEEKIYYFALGFTFDKIDLAKKERALQKEKDTEDINKEIDALNTKSLKLTEESDKNIISEESKKGLSDLTIKELLKLLDSINMNLESKDRIDEKNVQLINEILSIIKAKRK